MTFIIRKLRSEEGRLLKALYIGMSIESPTAFGGTAEELAKWSDEQWLSFAEYIAGRDISVGFVAEEGSAACGYVFGYVHTIKSLARAEGKIGDEESDKLTDTAGLGRMWVAPAMRGQGIGQGLIQAVFDWAQEHKLYRVLLAVTEGNEPARSLYIKAGFVSTGFSMPHPNYPELPIHYMEYIL